MTPDEEEGQRIIRRAYNHCESAEYQMRDGSNSPFLADMQDDFRWMVDYYESGKDAIEDLWLEHWGKL